MAGVEELNRAVRVGAPANEGGVLPGERAVAEEAIDLDQDLRERQAYGNQAAEKRVQLRHSHGCRHAFSRDVAEHEVKLTAGGVEVAIVAADRPEGGVVVAGFPAIHFQIRGRQVARFSPASCSSPFLRGGEVGGNCRDGLRCLWSWPAAFSPAGAAGKALPPPQRGNTRFWSQALLA